MKEACQLTQTWRRKTLHNETSGAKFLGVFNSAQCEIELLICGMKIRESVPRLEVNEEVWVSLMSVFNRERIFL